jgi:hypothetical protein
VYCDRYDAGVVLTTENGIRVTNTVVLEPEVLTALVRYLVREYGADAMRKVISEAK